MKYLKYFESNNNIDSICEQYGIKNYTINQDGSIDVDGSVHLNYKKLKKIPIKFKNVSGGFYCYNNDLKSLENSPEYVGNDFVCSDNKLKSLQFCPNTIIGDFDCSNNNLELLDYSPKYIGGNFICIYNKLKTLDGFPKKINGGASFKYNEIKSLKPLSNSFINKSILFLDNPLPEEIIQNAKIIKKIIKWQDDYLIWNKDGSLNKENFQELLDSL